MNLLLTNLDGRVALKGLLGVGGMGEVHRAWDAGLERPVAVKFVRSADPKEADRLLLEARLQARVEHRNVVRVLDTGTLEGRPCILLQLHFLVTPPPSSDPLKECRNHPCLPLTSYTLPEKRIYFVLSFVECLPALPAGACALHQPICRTRP